MSGVLTSLVQHYGLIAIFLLMAAESCGLPFPSEVIMPVGGWAVASGGLGLPEVILAGALGNLVGSLAAYGLAARFGTPLLLGPGRYVGFSRSHLELSQRWFTRYGLLAVLVGRVLPVVRTYISFPAGLARVRLVPFSGLTLVGAVPWCAALTLVGLQLGKSYEQIAGPIQKVSIGVALLVLIVIVAWFLHGRRQAAAASQPAQSKSANRKVAGL